jgi:hypothetical protein
MQGRRQGITRYPIDGAPTRFQHHAMHDHPIVIEFIFVLCGERYDVNVVSQGREFL